MEAIVDMDGMVGPAYRVCSGPEEADRLHGEVGALLDWVGLRLADEHRDNQGVLEQVEQRLSRIAAGKAGV